MRINSPESKTGLWLWLSGVALIVILQFWWLPGGQRQVRDSYSSLSGGKLGLYRILKQLYPDVQRISDQLIPDRPATLILVDPLDNPSEDDCQKLDRFIRDGGALVFAPPRNPGTFDQTLLPFRIRLLEPGSDILADSTNEDNTYEQENSTGPDPQDDPIQSLLSNGGPELEELTVESSLVNQGFGWRTAGEILPGEWTPHEVLGNDLQDRMHIVAFRMGKGLMLVCSGGEVFSNESLLVPDNAELAVRIVEYARRSVAIDAGSTCPVFVSETLNDSRVGDTWAILLGPSLRSGTLQMVLIGLLVAWAGYYRFGPPIRRRDRVRKNMTDSAEALGNLQFRTRDGGKVVARYLEYIQFGLRRATGSQNERLNSAMIAARTGLPESEIRNRLDEAARMAAGKDDSPSETARMIRWLALLNQRLTHPRLQSPSNRTENAK